MPDLYFRVVYSAQLDERQCPICSNFILLGERPQAAYMSGKSSESTRVLTDRLQMIAVFS